MNLNKFPTVEIFMVLIIAAELIILSLWKGVVLMSEWIMVGIFVVIIIAMICGLLYVAFEDPNNEW